VCGDAEMGSSLRWLKFHVILKPDYCRIREVHTEGVLAISQDQLAV